MMKTPYIPRGLRALTLCLLFIACEQGYVAQSNNGDQSQGHGSSNVTGNVHLITSPTPSARLCCAIFRNGKKIQTIDADSSSETFEHFNFQLDPGAYQYIILGYDETVKPSISTSEITCKRDNTLWVENTYAARGELIVGDSAYEKRIAMQHISARIRFKWDLNFPDEATCLEYYYTGGSSTLDPITWRGCKQSRQTVVHQLNDTGLYDIYTYPHDSIDHLNIHISLLDAWGAVIAENELEDIPVCAGHTTVFQGDFFEDFGYLFDPEKDDETEENNGGWKDPYIINF